jgi:hypothetical protein
MGNGEYNTERITSLEEHIWYASLVAFEITQQHLDPGIQFFGLSPLRRDPLRLPKLSRLELFTLRRARSP